MSHTAFACTIFLCITLGAAQSLSPDVMRGIKNSSVYIKVLHRFPLTGQEVPTSGSGFFIKNELVVTNCHVIEPVIPAYDLTFPAPCTEIQVVLRSGSQSYRPLTAAVLAIDKENDLAILGVTDTAGLPNPQSLAKARRRGLAHRPAA